jgi:hypothetical protein
MVHMTRSMLRKLALAGAIAALAAASASAQVPISPFKALEKRPLTQEEIDKQKALDDAYKSATAKVPEKRVDDPWATVRPPPNPPKDKQASKTKQQ